MIYLTLNACMGCMVLMYDYKVIRIHALDKCMVWSHKIGWIVWQFTQFITKTLKQWTITQSNYSRDFNCVSSFCLMSFLFNVRQPHHNYVKSSLSKNPTQMLCLFNPPTSSIFPNPYYMPTIFLGAKVLPLLNQKNWKIWKNI